MAVEITETNPEVKEVKAEVVKIDTTNPFNKGVSYKAFLSNVKGNVTVDSLLKKANLSKVDSAWIKQELEDYKQNKKK